MGSLGEEEPGQPNEYVKLAEEPKDVEKGEAPAVEGDGGCESGA
jgi:hypothetical protein